MTVVAKHRSWTKRERHLYANQAVRATGAVDGDGRLEMEFLSGPLAGERRWMRHDELIQDAAVSDSEARDATFGGEHDSD